MNKGTKNKELSTDKALHIAFTAFRGCDLKKLKFTNTKHT